MNNSSGIDRFGFGVHPVPSDAWKGTSPAVAADALKEIISIVLEGDDNLDDSLSVSAQADFVVPLGMAASLFEDGAYSTLELLSAASTVRAFAMPHVDEFPQRIVDLLALLPK